MPEFLDHRSWPGDLRPDEYKALEEWVPANQVVLSALADAARCPYWWSEMKPEDGALSSVGVSHAVESRKCTFGVLLLAKYEAGQGNVEQGVRLLADLHMMGVHRIRAGALAEQLTGLAVCKVVHDAVFAILDHCQIDADLLAWTLDVFASRASRIVVPQFLEIEYLYGLDSIQRHFTDDGAGDGKLIPACLYESRKKLSL